MRVLLAVAAGIAAGLFALGPIGHIRAQPSRSVLPQPPPAVEPAPQSATPEEAADSVGGEIRVTDELVRAPIVRSPAPKTTAERPQRQIQRKPVAPRRSIWARLFLGDGGSRPKPFPTPAR